MSQCTWWLWPNYNNTRALQRMDSCLPGVSTHLLILKKKVFVFADFRKQPPQKSNTVSRSRWGGGGGGGDTKTTTRKHQAWAFFIPLVHAQCWHAVEFSFSTWSCPRFPLDLAPRTWPWGTAPSSEWQRPSFCRCLPMPETVHHFLLYLYVCMWNPIMLYTRTFSQNKTKTSTKDAKKQQLQHTEGTYFLRD